MAFSLDFFRALVCSGAIVFLVPNVFAQSPKQGETVKGFSAAVSELMRAPEIQATLSEIRSIEMDFDSREIVLQPMIEAEIGRINDRLELMNQNTTRKPRVEFFGFTLSKPFSTGTSLALTPSWESALTPSLTPNERTTVDWNLAITQSLWRDGFGRKTDLRRARESFERKRELAAALIRQGQVLMDFENLYWDWSLALRESELQDKNIKRSREILKWVQDRFNRAAAENIDLLQARALLTARELQLSTLKLSLNQVGTRMERYLQGRGWQPDARDLSLPRNPESLAVGWKAEDLKDVTSLEFLVAKNEAIAAVERAKEAREEIRPDLNLELNYGKNAIDPSSNTATRESYEEDHEYSSIGLVFRTGLDLSLERKRVESARAARDAAQMRSQSRAAENRLAWEQLKSELLDLQNRIVYANQLVDLQTRKANAERDRYRKGRSTAFQAITFEQEAVEAEITLLQLHALMRKTEAKARLFAR